MQVEVTRRRSGASFQRSTIDSEPYATLLTTPAVVEQAVPAPLINLSSLQSSAEKSLKRSVVIASPKVDFAPIPECVVTAALV